MVLPRLWPNLKGHGVIPKEREIQIKKLDRIEYALFEGCTKMFTYSDCKKCSKQPTSALQVQEFKSGNASNLALLLVAVTVVHNFL